MKKTMSEILILTIYIILVLGSSYIIFNSYINYSQLNSAIEKNILEMVIGASSLVLILSIFLFSRREYIKYTKAVKFTDKKESIDEVEKSIKIDLDNRVDINIEIEPKSKNSNTKAFNNISALVVEDNPINRKMMLHTLKGLGISSDMAEDGRIGYEMRMKNDYDIVFMDIQMPVMNGVESTKAILKYEKEHNLTHIPIIAVTANALMGDRERFLTEGMDEYISKPINLIKFTTILKKFFPTFSLKTGNKNDILLYKQTPTEAKIVGAILKKLGYSVDIAKSVEDLKEDIDSDKYHSILLDRVNSNTIHESVSQKIKSKNIPTLLFVDNNIKVVSSDREIYTHVTDKLTDFKCIKEKVDSMMI